MVKSRRRRKDEPTIKFDPAARYRYVTEFRKRKQERRRKAMRDIVEQERRDNMEVRKEIRDDVKRKWKEVQNAVKRIDKLMDARERAKAIKDGRPVDDEDKADNSIDNVKMKALSTVGFDQEDDDPFGGCEVTTSLVSIDNGMGLPGTQEPLLALPPVDPGTDLCNGETALAAIKKTPEEIELHRQKRAENMWWDEKRRQVALKKKVTKRLEEQKKYGRKQAPKLKGKRHYGHKKKTTIKGRRKQAKKTQRKAKKP